MCQRSLQRVLVCSLIRRGSAPSLPVASPHPSGDTSQGASPDLQGSAQSGLSHVSDVFCLLSPGHIYISPCPSNMLDILPPLGLCLCCPCLTGLPLDGGRAPSLPVFITTLLSGSGTSRCSINTLERMNEPSRHYLFKAPFAGGPIYSAPCICHSPPLFPSYTHPTYILFSVSLTKKLAPGSRDHD